MIRFFTRLFHSQDNPSSLLKVGVGSLLIKCASFLLSFILSVVLARYLGPKQFGIYSYIVAIIGIVTIPATLGLPKLMMRETVKAQANENWSYMRGLWRWTFCAALVMAGIIAVILLFFIFISDSISKDCRLPFLWGVVLIPLTALAALYSFRLQGLKHVILARLPQDIIRPLVFIMLIIIFHAISAVEVIRYHVLSVGVIFVILFILTVKRKPLKLNSTSEIVYKTHYWIMSVLPLALIAGMQQINKSTDIIMLGFYVPSSDIGIYRVSVQCAIFVLFGLQVIAMFISPYLTRMHIDDDKEKLQRLVTMCARISFAIALPVVLIFSIWGEELLGVAFGSEYRLAYVPLVILAGGQLINTVFGPVGILLNMTGNERDTLKGIGAGAIANILLNLILVPRYGIAGAALATSLSLCVWNILLCYFAKKCLSVNSSAFCKLR